MSRSELATQIRGVLLERPGHGFSYQDIADRLGEDVEKVRRVIPNLKATYAPVERAGKADRARVWWSTTADPDVCPLGKAEAPRWRLAKALAAAGGEVHEPNGGATRVLAELAGSPWPSTAPATLLLAMERDGFIKRSINGKRCYQIVLTEKGFSHFLVSPAEPEPAPEPEPEPLPDPVEVVEEPVVAEPEPAPVPEPAAEAVSGPETPPIRVMFYEGPPDTMPPIPVPAPAPEGISGIDYRELAHALVRENSKVAAPVVDTTRVRELEAQIEDLKIRLGNETEAAQKWRGEALTYKRQLEDEAKRKTATKRTPPPPPRPVVTEMQQIVEVIDKTPGWSYERSGGSAGTHIKILHNGQYVTTGSFGGSDHRSIKNCRAKLRREGLPV